MLFVAEYKYKFLNKEYEDNFGLNVTETDFRQYDSALGRFNVMDALSELAPNQTPYRYGFNNPVFWSDPSGLFETEKQAETFALDNGIKNYKISFNAELGGYILTIIGGEFNGEQFYDFGSYEILPEMEIQSGGGSDSSSNNKKEGDPGYNPFGFVFTTKDGKDSPVTPSRGPRDAKFIDASIIEFFTDLF